MDKRYPPPWKKCPSMLFFSLVILMLLFLGIWLIVAGISALDHGPDSPSDPNQMHFPSNIFYETDEDRKIGEAHEAVEPEPVYRTEYDPKSPRYIGIIGGFGPNNQYLGLKDVMYMAKLNGRILARPDFWTHAIDKLNSIRPFERTFAIDDLSKYLPTVSLKEFSEKCDHIVDTIIWGRPEGTWRRVVNLWLQHANMTVHKEVFRQNAMLLMTDTSIRDFYQPFQDQRCLLFAIPFRNVAESKERKSLAKYLTRAPWIVDIAKEAYKEMNVTSLMTIHWRWGEDSCGVWLSPSPNEEWEFCYGTAVFHYAAMESIFTSLRKIFAAKKVSTVYLAVSMKYHDTAVLEKLRKFMDQEKIAFFVGQESLKVLTPINDNYYLSLIEQEICAKSNTFIWSSDSTWSDFIVDHQKQTQSPLETISFSQLLSDNKFPFSTYNRLNDVVTLNQRKRI